MFFGEKVGIMSALMLSFTPGHLIFSVVAMSDIVSLFFITITIYFIYNFLVWKQYKYLYLASILLGLTVGVRQTDILLVPLYIVILIANRKDMKICLLSIFLFSISICAWFIPTVIDTGLNTYIELQRVQGAYAVNTSTLNLLGGLSFFNLIRTFVQFLYLLISGWSKSLLVFIILTLIYFTTIKSIILKNLYTDARIFILSYWFMAYFLFSLFVTNYI